MLVILIYCQRLPDGGGGRGGAVGLDVLGRKDVTLQRVANRGSGLATEGRLYTDSLCTWLRDPVLCALLREL